MGESFGVGSASAGKGTADAAAKKVVERIKFRRDKLMSTSAAEAALHFAVMAQLKLCRDTNVNGGSNFNGGSNLNGGSNTVIHALLSLGFPAFLVFAAPQLYCVCIVLDMTVFLVQM